MARCSMTGYWRLLSSARQRPPALRQVKVQLDGAALPGATDAVLQGELDLGAIKGTLARLQVVRQAGIVQRLGQRGLGTIPQVIVGADTLGRAGGELDH
jgi:hypothetical protein